MFTEKTCQFCQKIKSIFHTQVVKTEHDNFAMIHTYKHVRTPVGLTSFTKHKWKPNTVNIVLKITHIDC